MTGRQRTRTHRLSPSSGCIAAALAAVVALLVPARAQQVESFEIGLSTNEIAITSNFTGARLVVFGALDNADARLLRQQRYDIVVALVGPRRPVVVRKKERTLGIWINRGSETFNASPESYALASTRPLSDITRESLRVSLSLGIDDLRLNIRDPETVGAAIVTEPVGQVIIGESAVDGEGDPVVNRDQYASALRRIRMESGLYNQSFGSVEFVSPTLFRADLRLPADLPVGRHTVRAYLFRSGVFIRGDSEALVVVKTGLESLIDDFATRYGFLYGLFAVALAIFTGWFGRIVFKRD
ncbi:TIGR02186 family protein [Aurantimonas sp. C2-6-R+9]|uniref:TIGR02186 family protein n=1 Tax=unclassified Aurantimonas TaxID=2638230 RepID=UPI002E16E709|nr:MULTISPECIES: TIGR02186 family protein [unclassified Aurantimonas]MEC5291236.1 TIGR02186 family protein [Aurantimonas sp. C2-3-R2]MEC5322158.1 TIGR02186 family protein [Aurantimonas sp. A3-2-R12]MEC5380946.1 TIGR02186 family protein [Aurantimonas sp. C2-6-R+9]MEC5412274.1 TIGR02186 family protein [Aurantimonas sp. C2-4-R8]